MDYYYYLVCTSCNHCEQCSVPGVVSLVNHNPGLAINEGRKLTHIILDKATGNTTEES